MGSLSQIPPARAADGRSYQALRDWLEAGQNAEPTFQAGQRLTAADQEALKPFIPLPAWEYYFFPNWKYLGTRTVLATMNLADNPEAGGPHKWGPHKVRWELRDCHVIEQTPKDPSHPYGHKLVFIDTETV